ncbi:MAG: FtsX-like permease family protein [Lachnospiraceae bacterium]|nr:FtsX-like permease family protein [Lachnospiraceae bacterium]
MDLVFIEVSVNVLTKILTARQDSNFDSLLKQQISNDPFFVQRTDMIVSSMKIIMFVIIIFAAVTLILIRNLQLRSMLTQMGIYTILGYNKRKIYGICIVEPLAQIIIAFPISIIISMVISVLLKRIELINSLLNILDYSNKTNFYTFVFSVLIMFLVLIIHNIVYVNKHMKKGIRYMLGKGTI